MVRASVALTSVALILVGCAGRTPPPAVVIEPPIPEPTGWRALATPIDQQRLALLSWRWPRALRSVPIRFRSRVKAEGELLEPEAALELPTLPPGPYHCRLVRLGGRPGFRSFAPDFCYVDGDSTKLSFTKQTGSNLPGGWLHPDTPRQLVFLGAKPPAGRKEVPLYGQHAQQDVAAVVERVSPFRWRMVLANAGRGAMMDIYELVPVPGAQPALPAKS